MNNIRFFLISLFVVCSGIVLADDYYISNTGSDSGNDGSALVHHKT